MIGISLLGCGAIAAKRAANLPESVSVRTVFDVNEDRARSLAASLSPPPLVAGSPDEALAEEVELAVVATYHRDLVPLAKRAVEAGCHVLVEKPGARSAREMHSLRTVAAARNRIVRVGYNHRFHPAVLRAREVILGGAHGGLVYVRGRYGHGGRPGYDREWRAEPELSGGGELLDQGVHLIDLVQHLLGPMRLSFAEVRTDFWQAPVEDNAYLALRPEAGGFAWLHASWTEWKNLFSLEIGLRNAKLELVGLGGSYGTERLTLYEMLPKMGPPVTTTWEWPMADASWEREMNDVLSAIAGGPATGAGLDDAIATLEIVQQAYEYSTRITPDAPASARQ